MSCLTKITILRDQLVAIGTKVEDKELVSIALNALVFPWRPFVQGLCSQEKLTIFTMLWDDLVQKESGLESCSS